MASSTIPPGAMLKLAFPGLVDIPMLMPAEVTKLGNAIVAYLVKQKDTMQNFGEMVVLSFIDHENYQLFLRLVQFTKSAAYTPFTKDASTLFILRKNNAQERHDPKAHESKPYRSTDETFNLFTEEVKVLVFSIEIGHEGLQAYSARNIKSRYPIYTREVLHLIKTLTRREQPRSAFLRAELLVDPTLPEMLRTFVRPKDEMVALLDTMDDSTIKRLIRHCAPNPKATPPNAASLLDAFVKTQLMAPRGELASDTKASASAPDVQLNTITMLERPIESASDTPRSSITTIDDKAAHDMTRAVFAAIEEYRIVMPGDFGFGTLRKAVDGREFAYRNEDFKFVKGEVLLIMPAIPSIVNGAKNVVDALDPTALARIDEESLDTLRSRGAPGEPLRDPRRMHHPAEVLRTHNMGEQQREDTLASSGAKRSREQADAFFEELERKRLSRRE
nr:hypothetical protein B0A51_10635 [Rachicladosporium sp. CCFEE 5018]